jgi:hypothetical protein
VIRSSTTNVFRARVPKLMRLTLSRRESAALACGLAIALGFFVHQWRYPSSLYDAGQYAKMGRAIVEHGLFTRFTASALRTYGYPIVLSFIYRAAAALGLPFLVVLFATQLTGYVGAALLFRRALRRISPFAAELAFCGLMVNYYALIYTPECLTESLSISVLLVVGAIWLDAYRGGGTLGLLLAGSLIAGSSIILRPANLFIAVAWTIGVALVGWRSPRAAVRTTSGAVLVIGTLLLPLLPQMAYNGLRFGRWTPLLAQNLGTMQQTWGIRDIKYATAMAPIPEPAIHYVNPLSADTPIDEHAPWRWYAGHPWRGTLTLAIHTFNLLDQDLLFTYSRDLDPWYRVPLGIVNHGVVALGLVGLWYAFRHVRSKGTHTDRDCLAILLVMLGATWAMHVWTAVEMRFGFAILLALFPLAGYALVHIFRARSRRAALSTGVGTIAYIVAALVLSHWVRDQSALIRAAQHADTAAPIGATSLR